MAMGYFQGPKRPNVYVDINPAPPRSSDIAGTLREVCQKYVGENISANTFGALTSDILRFAQEIESSSHSRSDQMIVNPKQWAELTGRKYVPEYSGKSLSDYAQILKKVKDLEEQLVAQELKHKEEIEYYKMLTEEN